MSEADMIIIDNDPIDIEVDQTESLINVVVQSPSNSINLDVSESKGTNNYDALRNKPQIESVTLQGNKSFKQLGIDTLSVQEIEKILYLD